MTEKQFLDLYKKTKEALNARSANVFNAGRAMAERYLTEKGMPTKKDEAYLYCPLLTH